MEYMNGKELEETLIFQDFITDKLHDTLGWSINAYSSRKYNIEKGESRSGIEIKNDKRFTETGNLYIELKEKQKAETTNYADSGIHRKDNTLLYLIGDFNECWIFAKNQLAYMCDNYEKYGFKKVTTPTSVGILIPIEYLNKHKSCAITHIKF